MLRGAMPPAQGEGKTELLGLAKQEPAPDRDYFVARPSELFGNANLQLFYSAPPSCGIELEQFLKVDILGLEVKPVPFDYQIELLKLLDAIANRSFVCSSVHPIQLLKLAVGTENRPFACSLQHQTPQST